MLRTQTTMSIVKNRMIRVADLRKKQHMEITLKRLNDAVHLSAVNANGNQTEFDGTENIGGEGKAMTPMEALLSAVAACSTLDVIPILKKQRQVLEDLEVVVTGNRQKVADVNPFKDIHMHFKLTGNIDPHKAKKAVDLSVEKYCSVSASLDPTIKVTHSFEILDPIA